MFFYSKGTYPDCHWLPCPLSGYTSKTGYWPDCVAIYVHTCASRGKMMRSK